MRPPFSSGRIVANPEVMPFWSNFLVGGHSTETENFRTERSMSA
jgi:hypothetical protein